MAVGSSLSRIPVSAPRPVASEAAVPLRTLSFPALGTSCQVQYAAPQGDAQAWSFENRVMGWVTAFEAKYSRFRPDSLISRINAAAGAEAVAIDPEMEAMLALCDTLHFMTQGVLDPTLLPLIRLWDFKAPQPRLPAREDIAAARSLVGWKRVERSPGKVFLPVPGMAIDFGGFGKSMSSPSWRSITESRVRWWISGTTFALLACRPADRPGISVWKTRSSPGRRRAAWRSSTKGLDRPAIISAASLSKGNAMVISLIREPGGRWRTGVYRPRLSRAPVCRLACSRPRLLFSACRKALSLSNPFRVPKDCW